jgi:2-phosphosulfolactate phosphatase
VLPVADLEQARSRARELGALLGGERGGLAPPGFDLGNSPGSYEPAACAGRLVVLSTTNGSRAVEACADAASVLAGGLLNAEATARALVERRAERVLLVCAGRSGQVSADDAAAAGCIAGTLALRAAAEFGDAARLAIALFDAWRHDLSGLLSRCEAGRHLAAIGLAADLEDCVHVDSVPVVAERGRRRRVPARRPGMREDRRMPLRQHLDELRGSLIRCFIVVAVLFAAAFYWNEALLDVVIGPWTAARGGAMAAGRPRPGPADHDRSGGGHGLRPARGLPVRDAGGGRR